MHPAELAILLHRALEVRLARLQERLGTGTWWTDMEQLHQVRVGARRLGAVLDLVDAVNYPGLKSRRKALKRLVDLLGLPRELDVHAERLSQLRAEVAAPTLAAVAEHLLEQVDRDRAKARKAMEKALEHLALPELQGLLDVPALQNPFQPASLQEAAWSCLEERAGAALGDLETLVAREDGHALHKARVRIKKLRYAVEALEAAFAAPPEDVLRDLRDLQSTLGEHHDLAALEARLWEAEAGLNTRARVALREGVLELLGSVAEARREAFNRFVALAEGKGPEAFRQAVRPALGLPLPGGGSR